MKNDEIIALAKRMCSVHHGDGYIDFSVPKLIAFAKAIADMQKEKDAHICEEIEDECERHENWIAAPLSCADAIRSPEKDIDQAQRIC